MYHKESNLFKKIIAIFWITSSILLADKITLFAASDLKFALDSIKESFLQENPGNSVNIVYGSSGKGMLQVENGAPYDLYFSANKDYVDRLYKKADIVSKPKLYAIGRIVLWSKNSNAHSTGITIMPTDGCNSF